MEYLESLKFKSADIAYRRLLNVLNKQGFVVNKLIPCNQGRYLIVLGTENLLITFKRDVFHNFWKLNPDSNSKHVGDTINNQDIKTALSHEVTRIYSIFHSGNVYSLTIADFLEHSIKWTNLEGKEVRSIDIHKFDKTLKI